jgi:hypothetical protein
MIDVEDRLREELNRFVPSFAPGDWNEVIAIAGPTPARLLRRRAAIAVLAIVAALAVSVATPLGAAIVRGFGDFSAWLTGEPGSPVSRSRQQAFDRANARSWAGFPSGTKLRHLITATDPADGARVELLGFRAGSTLCLRVVVTGKTSAGTQSCAPLADLRQSGSPVRAVLVDHGFGQGTKRAWFGIDRLRSSARQVTAGIVADGVQKVIVRDRSGRHDLPVTSNAFLYVASTPEIGQRVQSIQAKTPARLITVPFAAVPFDFGTLQPPRQNGLPGPTRLDRHLTNGTIGWLDKRELRGQPLSVIPHRSRTLIQRHAVFGRVVAPDPDRPMRVALTLSTSRHGGRATGLCTWLIDRGGGAGGGCAVRADLFSRGPIAGGAMLQSGSDQFATLEGIVSDDVARLDAFLANGEKMTAPLHDNVYLIDVARAKMPVRLVAYDAQNRVIGIQAPFGGFRSASGPAQGRAASVLKVTSPTGATAELLIGAARGGGHCFYVRTYFNKHAAGIGMFCGDPPWRGQSLALGTSGAPAQFLTGRVRADVARVRVAFADGATMTVKPIRGFVLAAIPREHLAKQSHVAGVTGYNNAGHKVGSQSFRPPRPARAP